MIQTIRTAFVPVLLAAATLSLLACKSLDTPAAPSIKYYVSDLSVTVVSAVTPFEADKEARETFLHWFKRGFETVLAGNPPLMIEWDNTPKGKAGRSGYDFGMDEGEKYRARPKAPDRSIQTILIPPGII